MTSLPRLWLDGRVAVAIGPREDGIGRRRQVAALLDRPESEVVLRRAATGKPVLDAPAGASCSFAHRDGSTVVAAAERGELGVDLEFLRDDLDACEIADALFAPAEAEWLRALDAARRNLAFTALWCVKEAALKASGHGITGGVAKPIVDGASVMPLLAGAAAVQLDIANGIAIELRIDRSPHRPAIACVALRPRSDLS